MELSKKQQDFIDFVSSGRNVFLTGKAGTGKSFAVKIAIQKLQDEGKNVVALAPTGVAANNIGGQTIHSMFGLNPFGIMDYESCRFLKTEKRRLIKGIDTIFIDEVSMLRPDILDAINWTMLKNGVGSLMSKQIIFVGDLKQLPPPLDDNARSVLLKDYDGAEFWWAKIYKEMNVEEIELEEILRQSDPEFIEGLNLVRDNIRAPYFRKFVGTEQKGVVLAPYNATVAEYNAAGLAKIDSPEIVFTATVWGNVKADDFNLENEIKVKHGAKIMYLVNSKNNPLVNGTIGEFVVRENEDSINYFIKVGEEEYALKRMEFTKKEYVLGKLSNRLEMQELGGIEQMPIKLAYALSIHKSQGLTFNEVTVDIRRPCFCSGQLYVALSRVTGPEGLRIIM